MTQAQLRREHQYCDRKDGLNRVLSRILHIRRRGCPVCKKLRLKK